MRMDLRITKETGIRQHPVDGMKGNIIQDRKTEHILRFSLALSSL